MAGKKTRTQSWLLSGGKSTSTSQIRHLNIIPSHKYATSRKFPVTTCDFQVCHIKIIPRTNVPHQEFGRSKICHNTNVARLKQATSRIFRVSHKYATLRIYYVTNTPFEKLEKLQKLRRLKKLKS